MSDDDTPLGEYLDLESLPMPTILATTQNLDRLASRIKELEAQNRWLRCELEIARGQRDAAEVRATWMQGSP